MQSVSYLRRGNAFSRSEREWRAEEHDLVTVGTSGAEKRFAWSDMLSVRLCAEPARGRPWRYVLELHPKRGGKIVIDNASYIGPGRFEERSSDYAAFVRASIDRLHVAKPQMRALIGETPRRYFFLLMLALLGLCGLAFTLIAVRTPLDSLPYAPLIKLAIVLAMLPVFWGWVLGHMPRGVALTDIPDRALPPA